jgi:hypothetical protein
VGKGGKVRVRFRMLLFCLCFLSDFTLEGRSSGRGQRHREDKGLSARSEIGFYQIGFYQSKTGPASKKRQGKTMKEDMLALLILFSSLDKNQC